MSQITFEQGLEWLKSLPPDSLTKIRDLIEAETARDKRIEAVRAMAHATSLRDLSEERRWLREHCDEYAGQWVALKGSQLISHGKDHLAVHRAAKAAGHPDALMELVEPSDALPFIF
jgi:Family of unknown function (DUF5678)